MGPEMRGIHIIHYENAWQRQLSMILFPSPTALTVLVPFPLSLSLVWQVQQLLLHRQEQQDLPPLVGVHHLQPPPLLPLLRLGRVLSVPTRRTSHAVPIH